MHFADLKFARDAADRFRSTNIKGSLYDKVPLDTVYVADVVLKLDFIPFPNLFKDYNTDAALSHDLQQLYVDEFSYSHYDDPRAQVYQKDRLRFSVAHEIGHIVLHKDHVLSLKAKDFSDLLNAFNSADGKLGALEQEANEFAGRLIVPYELLKERLSGFQSIQDDPNWRDSFDKRSQFIGYSSKAFGLNPKGMDARLNREELWPSDWVKSNF